MPRKIHPSLQTLEFTLDGIVFPPVKIPRFEASQVDLSSQITKRVILQRPLLTSPMDTVTGSRMAIMMALQGGIGVIHHGYSTIEEQVREVEKVKRYEAGFVVSPVVVSPDNTILDLIQKSAALGFSSFPVTLDGTLNSKLIGIVTDKDILDAEEVYPLETKISKPGIMTPRLDLVVARREDTLDKQDIRAANKILRARHLDTLIIVDKADRVIALVTRSDLKKDKGFEFATKDDNNQLKVYAAVPPRLNDDTKKRIQLLFDAGINGIVVDSRNIYGGFAEIAKYAKKQVSPEIDVIVGNVVSSKVLKEALKEAGKYIDAFRVGIGTGEVCTTTEDLGLGRAMGSTMLELDQTLKEINNHDQFGHVGLIADGGIKSPRHFIAVVMLGGVAVMMGSALARFDESPTSKHQRNDGFAYKMVRGMGSEGAINDRSGAGAARYGSDQTDITIRHPEGIEKLIPYLGDGGPHIIQFWAGVRAAMHGLGAHNLKELYDDAAIYPAVASTSKGSL